MEKGLVSVVLPVYNVERYLNRCIESVVNQTYRNLEIILIDDGSPDNCPRLCDEWAKKDRRIKVVHKQNEGLGYARNTGIDNATGEYICFFDSDDYVDLRTVELTYKLACEYKTDIVTYGYNCVNSKGEISKSIVPNTSKAFYESEEIMDYFFPNIIAPDMETGEVSNLWISICGSLFSMDLINRAKWRVASERDIISEDVYSMLKLYKYVNRVGVIRESLYFYCVNMSSLSRSYKSDRFKRLKHFYSSCIKLCDELAYSDKVKRQLSYPFVSFTIGAMKQVLNTDKSYSILKEMVNDELLQEALSSYKTECESRGRKLFIEALKRRSTFLCYMMLKVRT